MEQPTYYAKNRDKCKQYQLEYYYKNKDNVSRYFKEYYCAHRETLLQRNKEHARKRFYSKQQVKPSTLKGILVQRNITIVFD